jgi:hypothetical protein
MFLLCSCLEACMTTPSQALRALAASVEAVLPELSPAAQSALGVAASQVHAAADAEAAVEAQRIGGPVAGGLLSLFATQMVDGFFALIGARHAAAPAAGAQ